MVSNKSLVKLLGQLLSKYPKSAFHVWDFRKLRYFTFFAFPGHIFITAIHIEVFTQVNTQQHNHNFYHYYCLNWITVHTYILNTQQFERLSFGLYSYSLLALPNWFLCIFCCNFLIAGFFLMWMIKILVYTLNLLLSVKWISKCWMPSILS